MQGSHVGSTVYFLALENGRWEIEATSGDLPGASSPIGLTDIVLEGDLAVVTGFASPLGVGFYQYLYTFHRTDGGGWEYESIRRVPGVEGFVAVVELRLMDGLLTFSNREKIFTYERVGGAWERRPNANINPTTVGAPDVFSHSLSTRGEDELMIWTDLISGSVDGWHLYRWAGKRWLYSQSIGNVQPPNLSGNYIPNGGRDIDGEWLMYGAHPEFSGVGVVIVMKKDVVTGQYEYHSTLKPASSIPGGADARDQFGASLDLDGARGRLIVGASESGRPIGGIAGRAYLYDYDEATDSWEQIERISYSWNTQHTPDTYITFGHGVALWGNGALVSSPLAPSDDGTEAVGRLHVFEDSFGTSYCPGTVSPSGLAAELTVSGSNVLPDAGLQLRAEGLPSLTPFAVLLSGSSASVALPGGNGEAICIGGPRINTGGLRTSAADGTAVVGFDLDDAGLSGVVVGDRRYAQVWFRMPASAGQPVGLTNAVDVQFD